jgi:L-asparaginase
MILIINTGGTFNKIYNEIKGKLIVPKNNIAIENILKLSKISNYHIKGMIYKDSLEITSEDRDKLVSYIQQSKYKKIIIVHGTDTIDQTAKYIAKRVLDKKIVLTAAMKPFSIDPIEATSNFMLAYGFLSSLEVKNNIYISMHGNIKKYTKIKKNYKKGIFECR